MAELYTIKHETLAKIANAVRAKKGTTAVIAVSDLASEINNLDKVVNDNSQPKVVTFTEDNNITLNPDSSYNGISKVTINSNLKRVGKVFTTYTDSDAVERPTISLTSAEKTSLNEGRGNIRLYNPADPEDPANTTKREWRMTYYGPFAPVDISDLLYDFSLSGINPTTLVVFTNVTESAYEDENLTAYFVINGTRCIYIGAEDVYGTTFTDVDINNGEIFTTMSVALLEYYEE